MEIMVEFILVSGEFPIDEVYKKIGLPEGHKEMLKEAKHPTSTGKPYVRGKECSITYSTGYIETYDTEIPIKKIYDMLSPKEHIITECIEEYNITSKFCIVLNLTDNPAISLPRDFISLVSELHAEIEFDTYINI